MFELMGLVPAGWERQQGREISQGQFGLMGLWVLWQLHRWGFLGYG